MQTCQHANMPTCKHANISGHDKHNVASVSPACLDLCRENVASAGCFFFHLVFQLHCTKKLPPSPCLPVCLVQVVLDTATLLNSRLLEKIQGIEVPGLELRVLTRTPRFKGFRVLRFQGTKGSKVPRVLWSFKAPRPQGSKQFQVEVPGTRVLKNQFFVKSLGARNYFRVATPNVPIQEFQVPYFAGGVLSSKISYRFEGSNVLET